MYNLNYEEIKKRINPYAFYTLEMGCPIKFISAGGNSWQGVNKTCPFHNDKNPGSFYIHEETGNFKCFACGAKGNMIGFYMQKHGVDFKTALEELNRRFP